MTRTLRAFGWTLGAMLVVGLFLAGCAGSKVEGEYPDPSKGQQGDPYAKRDSIFGEGGLTFSTGGSKKGGAGGGPGVGVGVNSFLWRASLDTIAFMPVTSADPFGGVIITDWYSPPESPDERFKVNIYILGRTLRADGLRVAVFRQGRDGTGWRDVALSDDVNSKLEDAILTRARQLRAEVLQQ